MRNCAATRAKGAVRAWLCGDDTVQDGVAFGTRGPLDPLTVDVDKAISWFLTAPEADRDGVCTADYRLTYIVAFEYDDGSLIPVSQTALAAAKQENT